MEELTKKQARAYRFIVEWWKQEDNLPTTRQLTRGLGLNWQSSGVQYFNVLVKKGWLQKRGNGKNGWYRFNKRKNYEKV